MNILIHLGYSKTGSSYIQSAVAKTDLANHGIAYPIDEPSRKSALSGKITSGNFWPRPGALETIVTCGMKSGLQEMLISSESIFDVAAAPESKFFDHLLSLDPEARIRAICFVRDPIDHAVSVYQQMVKRGGYFGTLGESLDKYDVVQKCVNAFARMHSYGAELTVLNYSRHEKVVLSRMEEWLRVPEGTLERPAVERVNRSLTRAELKFQIEFNKRFGAAASRIVSDPLCNDIPEVESEVPDVELPDVLKFAKRMRAEISSAGFERFMPKDEFPKLPGDKEIRKRFSSSGRERVFGLTSRQIEVLVKEIVLGLPKL